MDDDHRPARRLPRGVALREVRRDDGLALVRFHEARSSESTQFQSAAVRRRLGAEELLRLTTVDRVDRDALVAVRGRDIVAVGGYSRIDASDIAEVVVAVADPWQDSGVAAVLFERLAVRARTRGFAGLDVLVRPEHQGMLEVFHRSGLALSRRVEDGLVRLSVSLLQRQPTARAEPVVGDGMRWQRTSVRYITRYRSTDARYTIESVGGANARWHLRRRRTNGSDLVGVFASAQDASAAAEADASSRARHPDGPGTVSS